MWFDISYPKIICFLFIVGFMLAAGQRVRRWLPAIWPLALLAMLAPGYDMLGMLLAFALLLASFVLGMYWAPRLKAATLKT